MAATAAASRHREKGIRKTSDEQQQQHNNQQQQPTTTHSDICILLHHLLNLKKELTILINIIKKLPFQIHSPLLPYTSTMGGGVSSPSSDSDEFQYCHSQFQSPCVQDVPKKRPGSSHVSASPGSIHWVAAFGPPARVEKLLSEDSIRDQMNDFHEGNTPLMLASSLGNAEICKLLIVAGAARDVINKDGLTACEMAKDILTREVFDSTTRI